MINPFRNKLEQLKAQFAELTDAEAFEVMTHRRNEAIKKALQNATKFGHEPEYIDSMKEFFEERGYLTDRQIDSLTSQYIPPSRYYGNDFDFDEGDRFL